MDKATTKKQIQENDTLKINEDYAKKFTYNKQREALEKAKLKYGKDFMNYNEEESESDDQSEDSDGEMINENVMKKFIETYIKLKDDNLAREFLVNKEPVFNDEDFKTDKKKEKKENIQFGIKDALLNYKGEDSNEVEGDNIYSVEYQAKKIIQQDPEKDEFLRKLGEEDELIQEEDEGDYVDDGFLKINKNSSIVIVDDTKEIATKQEKVEEELESLSLEKVLQKAKIKPKDLDTQLLTQIWGDDKNLDKNEKFLRNYILSEAWLENDENKINKRLLLVDKEDEEKDEQFEEFEHKYNHRFEEEGGANITTYQRNIPDSYRIKDDSRAQKRKQREQRLESEKEAFKSELQMAKDIKKQEMKKKLEVIEKIAGTDRIKEIIDQLEDEFDPDKFDEKMNKIFNEEYYGVKDKEDDIKQAIGEKSFDYKTETKIPNKEKLEKLEELENNIEEDGLDENMQADQENYEEQNEEENYPEGYEEDENYDEEENEEPQWFYCDECKKAIKENKIKYECDKCEDYVTCKDCFKSLNHPHVMKKSKVPLGCKPPEDWEDILANVKEEEAESTLTCTNCSTEIINNYYYICSEESCSNIKICKTCRGIGKSVHEHKLSKQILEEQSQPEINPKDKLNTLLDSMYHAVPDKIIAKEIATKFHYTKTDKDDIGLSDEMLIYLDDRILNKHIPLRRLAPYREKFEMNDWQKKKILKELSREVEREKSRIAKSKQMTEENIKRNTKFLSNKRKGKITRGNDTVEEYQKKKRLETYGIVEE